MPNAPDGREEGAVRILIVDDHAILRDGLKRILQQQPRADVFGEASSAEEARALVAAQDWDVVVLDISLGGESGLDVLTELTRIRPGLRVLMLSMYSEEQYARPAFAAGAAGYIMKDRPRAELVEAVTRVSQGGRYVSPALADALTMHLDRDDSRPLHERLSQRELEVMRLLGTGRTVTGIAALLSLSDKTVSTYRARILEKLHLKTTADIVRYAITHHLLV